jgi:hypothetical protein
MRKPRPADRFICNSCGQHFINSRALLSHVEKHRRECAGDCKDGKK